MSPRHQKKRAQVKWCLTDNPALSAGVGVGVEGGVGGPMLKTKGIEYVSHTRGWDKKARVRSREKTNSLQKNMIR